MALFNELFGEELLTKTGLKKTADVVSGKKAVGVYFSAHWCPPCRGFTPKLAGWYDADLKGKDMEIVFVSSDKDEDAFSSYYGEQPWVALPYANRAAKDALNKRFKVSGIPSFVILDADGAVITKDGRDAVSSDPKGEKFPWIPPTKAEKAKMLADNLGDLVAKSNGKPMGLYFSAHWCPPCRGFTPKLAEWYSDGLKEKMEIIFVSSDKDEDAFNEYFKDMPWLALPYSKRDEKTALSEACGVEGIPAFVIVNPDGTILTTDGRSGVTKDPKAENFPEGWLPQPFNDVNDDPGPLNEEQCLVMLGNNDAAVVAVKEVATEYYEKAGKDLEKMPMRFFSGPDGGVTEQLKKLCGDVSDKLVLLDIPDDGGFYVCDGDVTVESIKAFIEGVKAKTVERKQLQK